MNAIPLRPPLFAAVAKVGYIASIIKYLHGDCRKGNISYSTAFFFADLSLKYIFK